MISREEIWNFPREDLKEAKTSRSIKNKNFILKKFQGNIFDNISDVGRATRYLNPQNKALKKIENSVDRKVIMDNVIKKMSFNLIQN